ncbi:MAG: glycosyltransferase 87 family protein [Aigarchaeota archaeon]|nr:glycosyltransferase 87 family protein [Aigarchaeota archaeon]MDW8092845.1 glycosyltransferase 87 family protein [Nitrososphaerota archaeon]
MSGRSRINYLLLLALSLSVVSWTASVLLHMPDTPWSIYSDVVSFWYRGIYEPGERSTCVDYFFEYPPLACFIVYASISIGGDSLMNYYLSFSTLSLPAFIALGFTTYWISNRAGRGWMAPMLVLSPSLIVYGIYNFDHFFIALVTLSLIAYLSGRRSVGALLLGVSISTKLISVFLLPVYLIFSSKAEMPRTVAYAIIGAAVPLLPVIVLNPGWLSEFLRYHSTWYLENAWFVWIFGDPYSQSARTFSFVLMGYLILKSYINATDLLRSSFTVLSAFLLGSYVFTPQMLVWLVPLMPLLPLNSVALAYPILESSNVLIILSWFGNYNPLMPGSPTQIFALIRAVALAYLYVTVMEPRLLERLSSKIFQRPRIWGS